MNLELKCYLLNLDDYKGIDTSKDDKEMKNLINKECGN